jgi:N-acetylneuraminic acid mutarotase
MTDADSYQWRVPGGTTGNGSTGNSVNLTFSPAFDSGYLSVNGTNACGNGDTSIMTLSVTNCGDNWVRKSDFIGPRADATGFSIGNKGYIGAGMNSGSKKDFWEFDPILNIWTQKADIGKKTRQGGTGFSIGKKGYFGIGYNGNFRKDWWEYDPVLNVWTQRADFAGTGRTAAVGFAIGNRGYLGTGRPEDMSYLKDFWEFDPDANEWLQKADFGGTARYSATGFSISNVGYLGIGIDAAYTGTKDFWAYDPALDIWTKMADFGGEPRLNAVGFSIGQKGYIGTGDNFNNGVYTYSDFWEYDPTSNFWTRKADFSGSQRTNATGFSIGNKGFIGTGYEPNGTEPQDFWEYTPDGFRPGLLADNLFCGGIPLKIPFTVTIPRLPGNVFTAQLSDSLGNFTNPVEIGSVSGIYSDTIGGVLPVVARNGARYRIRVTSSSPAGTSTDILYDLSVFSPTQAGMVSGSKTISLGSSTDTLKLNGYTGSIVKWQKQLDGGGFGDISQTPGLICYLETPTETGTWEFRAMIKNGTCGTELSTPAAVTVVHGPILRQWTGIVDDRWNEPGNWNPSGAPGPQDDAIIPATANYMPVVRANGYSCNNILIQLGASCTVNPGITLTVNGLVTIEGQ